MSDQGKANYEAWRKADGWHGSSSEDLEYDDLPSLDRHAFDVGADAVEQWLAEAPVDEDAPGSEPPKVIVVTEAGGRERFYAADGWDAEEAVDVTSKGDVVATYPPGAWQRIHRDGATLPDVTLRKLSLAMQALQKIGATVLEADDKRRVPVGTARDALEQIAELDL